MQRLLIGTISILAIVTCVASASAQDVTRPSRREPTPEIHYPLSADSLKQDDVPQGQLEGP